MSDKLKTLDMHAVERLFGAILDKPAPQAEAVGLINGKPDALLTKMAQELQIEFAKIDAEIDAEDDWREQHKD